MSRRPAHRTALGDALALAAMRRDLETVRASFATLAGQIDAGRSLGRDVTREEADLGRLAVTVARMSAELETLHRAA